MPTLTVTSSSGEELSFDITGPIMTIGRNPENAIAKLVGEMPEAYAYTKRVYEKLGKGDLVRVIESVGEWTASG